MTEEQKESLKEKLKQLLDEKLNSLTSKFENDINTIETLKYSYFDNVVLPYREIEEKEKEKKEQKESKKEEKHEETKEKKENKEKEDKTKKAEEGKTFKKIKPLSLKETNLTKTPLKPNKKRDLGFREKTEVAPKKSTKIFSDKKKSEPAQTQPNESNSQRMKKKNLTTSDVTKKSGTGRPSKTPINKRGRKADEEKEAAPKAKTIRATAAKTTATKRFTGKGKAVDKKGKRDKKKVEKGKEKVEEEKKEEVVEEKKKVVLKDKSLIKIPEDLKDNNALINLFFVLKGKYLTNKEMYYIILTSPKLYKSFGSDIKFLLDDKKQEIKTKINELQTFLNNYGDLESHLSKKFTPSKSAQNSLAFVKREEFENIIKKGDIPSEVIKILKLLFYIFDIPFDENLEGENLMNYFIQEVMDKNGAKDLRTIAINYISTHKDLNITKEKLDKVNSIVTSDEKVLSSVEMSKIGIRSISYCTLLIKECHEFMNSKTLDDVPIYELKLKNKMLQEYKDKLAVLENNGVPPKVEEGATEIKENENNENKIETTNAEENNEVKESQE